MLLNLKLFTHKNPVDRARLSCRKKFLHYFPKGFVDKKYLDWEHDYKMNAHLSFREQLNQQAYTELLKSGKFNEISLAAARIESRTNLLFSFEKMALRDAIKSIQGAEAFAYGLFNYIYGRKTFQKRFEEFVEVIGSLPRKQTRVLTWPLVTVFGFIGNPAEHFFLKPRVTQEAAKKYNYDFIYKPKPNWETYQSVLGFAEQVRKDNKDLKPKDYIDLQSFIWVLGSEEYP